MSVDERFMARLFGVLSSLVTIVWLVGYLAPIWRPSYQPPPELNIVMMAIVGVFVSLYTKAKNPRDPRDGDSDDKSS
ncbi:hypothetical protein IU459_26970 [Nocardia amamiensis]|uniref:Uncharacterized protein n=1 Tax=Nocardia amamiensis TaxID=404578 RepID=A0ABS0CZ82_9NOCA|nr:hypothetical protein [Nocardia amamiensis]MBF6301158.1 hypothetical protein [Nocardia amamiensis]